MPLEFEEYSWFDNNGRILKISGDNDYVYRAITDNSFQIFDDLSKRGSLPALYKSGLVETEISSLQVDGFAAVLKHKRIPFVSEPNEWTMRMLREAGMVICKLALELDNLGYGLQDSHPWNVSFNRAQPVFFDWGSVIRKEQVSKVAWLLEFRRHIFIPLWLFSKGLRTLAYESMWERRGGSAKYLFNHPYLRAFPLSYRRLLKMVKKKPFQNVLVELLEQTSRIKIENAPGIWSDYDQGSYSYKDQALKEFLGLIPAHVTILDVGANRGAYSIACSKAGHRVAAFDYDAKAVDYLYEFVKNNDVDIVSLLMDIMRPTPPYGPDLSSPSIFDRLHCDYVLAFAVSHHLAKNYSLRFESLARILEKYARNGVLVEYIDKEDVHLQNWIKKGWKSPAWYTEQDFVTAFGQYFSLEKVWQTVSDDEHVRKLFYFKRLPA